jgi:hypothetical protein
MQAAKGKEGRKARQSTAIQAKERHGRGRQTG